MLNRCTFNYEYSPAFHRSKVMNIGSRVPVKKFDQNPIHEFQDLDLERRGDRQSQTLSSGLQNGLATAWKADDPFSDFDVVVEGFTFRCHKHLLNATSGYFQAVFRSGMKESIENRLELNLMPREVFEVILKALYTGVTGLTKNNITEIWPATQFLQMHHLSDECERFALHHLCYINCIEMYYFAESILSSKLAKCAKNCMVIGFEAMIQTEAFLQMMTPDLFLELLENRRLSVSGEDVVVDSILRWAHYQPEVTQNEDRGKEGELKDTPITMFQNLTEGLPANITQSALSLEVLDRPVQNDRQKHLPALLRSARLLLVSVDCLRGLIGKNLFSESPESLEIVQEAAEFLSNHDANHRAWKKSATHRLSSLQEHAVVIMTSDQLTVYRMEYPHVVRYVASVPHTPGMTYENMIVFKNKIFMEGVSTFFNTLVTLDEQRTWNHVMFDDTSYEFDVNSNNSSRPFSHNGYMYRFNAGVLYRFCEFPDDDAGEPLWAEVFRSDVIVDANEIVCFQSFILFFINTERNAVVYGLDTETSDFRTMCDFDDRARCLNTINDGNNTYTLQPCGALKRLVKTDDGIRFERVAQLWDCEWFPLLALTYLNKLFIFGKDFAEPLDTNTVKSVLPGLFDCIEVVKLDEGHQCFPMIVPRHWFSI